MVNDYVDLCQSAVQWRGSAFRKHVKLGGSVSEEYLKCKFSDDKVRAVYVPLKTEITYNYLT